MNEDLALTAEQQEELRKRRGKHDIFTINKRGDHES